MKDRFCKYFILVAVILAYSALQPSTATAGELFSIRFQEYNINSRSLFSSGGGYYRRNRTTSLRRSKASTAAARVTMPKLDAKVNPKKSYDQLRVKELLKQQKQAQKDYQKALKAYERELQKEKRQALNQQRDAQRKLDATRKKLQRERKAAADNESAVVEVKENSGSAEGDASAKSVKPNASGLSFWQRLKQAIFGK